MMLNELIFTAGPNAIVPANYVNQFSFTENVTINTGTSSGTAVLNVPFNLSINSSDTLTVVGGTTVSIPVGSSIWNIVVNGFSFAPNSGGPEIGFLTAQISDPPSTPLPAALVLFGSGLGAMELMRRRRKVQPLHLTDACSHDHPAAILGILADAIGFAGDDRLPTPYQVLNRRCRRPLFR